MTAGQSHAAPIGNDLPGETPEGPATILLVDDERGFADALAMRLATRGIVCLVTYDGISALNHLENTDIEVVVLDLNMPGAHGLDVLREMKAMRPEVEVILFTGDASMESAATGMRRGAGDYLVKPVMLDNLLSSLQKARQRVALHREQMRAMEASKLMALGSLATGVGHEINNPLQVLLQRAELLQELVQEAGKVWNTDSKERPDFGLIQKTAAIMEQQTRRIASITSQLLDLAYRSKTGTAEVNIVPVLESVTDSMKERADALNVALSLNAGSVSFLLPCSRAELEPVFMHLCRNALDAIEAAQERHAEQENTQADGRITGRHRVRIEVLQKDTLAVVTIADTGEGIAHAHAAEIFNPFFSTRPVGKGVGLGLTVCHSLLTALRGSIRFAPQPGGGTIFTVTLPITDNI
jgi:Signal transduction histidine kinase regulating C4-dicarboxylate transport system